MSNLHRVFYYLSIKQIIKATRNKTDLNKAVNELFTLHLQSV